MENNTSTPRKKSKVPFILLGVVVVIGGYFGTKRILHGIHYVSTNNAQVEANNLPVISRVNGYIDSILVGDYQVVQKGDLLLVLDDRELQIALQQAEADLLTAQADLLNARAQLSNLSQNKSLTSSTADVQKTRVDKSTTDMNRDEALYKEGAITQRQYEDTKNNLETAQRQYRANLEQVKLAQTQIGTAEAQLRKAEAMIKVREAMVEQARLRLSYTRIYAPVAGKLGKVGIQTGQYIQPGQNLFSIIDNTRFWVIANFKETQLSRLQEGQTVEIHIDGWKKKKVEGKVASFSEATGSKFALLPPDNATGNFVKVTQRVPVKIEFTNMEELLPILKAGLSVSVDVRVK